MGILSSDNSTCKSSVKYDKPFSLESTLFVLGSNGNFELTTQIEKFRSSTIDPFHLNQHFSFRGVMENLNFDNSTRRASVKHDKPV